MYNNEYKMFAEALDKSGLCSGRIFSVEDFTELGIGRNARVFAVSGADNGPSTLAIKVFNKGQSNSKGGQENNSGELMYREFCSQMVIKLSPHLVPTFYVGDNLVIMRHFNGKNLGVLEGEKLMSTMEKVL